jgi:hypothetical protein
MINLYLCKMILEKYQTLSDRHTSKPGTLKHESRLNII